MALTRVVLVVMWGLMLASCLAFSASIYNQMDTMTQMEQIHHKGQIQNDLQEIHHKDLIPIDIDILKAERQFINSNTVS